MNIQKAEHWRADYDGICHATGRYFASEHFDGFSFVQDNANTVLIEIHDEPDDEDFVVAFQINSQYYCYGTDLNSLLPFFERKINNSTRNKQIKQIKIT